MRILLAWLMLGLTAGLLAAEPAPNPMAERLARDDKNGDGKVTREEFRGPAALFDRLDQNHDGAITQAEIARRQQRQNPTSVPQLRLPAGWKVVTGVEFAKVGDISLTLNLVLPETAPETPLPMVIFIHGGGWRNGNANQGVQRLVSLAEAGIAGASINYRLTDQAIFPAQLQDCQSALLFLRAHAGEYHINPKRIGVWGSSAGAHLAALLGTSAGVPELMPPGVKSADDVRVQAVCDWYGPSDFASMMEQPSGMNHRTSTSPESLLLGGTVAEKPDTARLASPLTHVSADDPPFLIMHGTEDRTVPYAQSPALHQALLKAGVRSTLVPLEGAGHGGREFAAPDITRQVVEFFTRELAGKAAEKP